MTKRTSAGLRETLFNAIEALQRGDIEAADGKAIAALSQQICNTVSLEIEVAKLRLQYPSDAKMMIPSPLMLGAEKIPSKDSE